MAGKHKNPHFAVRVPKELMSKLQYVASYNGRSGNKEIEQLIIKHVDAFEKEHGIIEVPDEESSSTID